jgi:hypothetical protein
MREFIRIAIERAWLFNSSISEKALITGPIPVSLFRNSEGGLNFTKALDTQSPGMRGCHMCGQRVIEATAVVSEGFNK